jgi:hypothetical protein
MPVAGTLEDGTPLACARGVEESAARLVHSARSGPLGEPASGLLAATRLFHDDEAVTFFDDVLVGVVLVPGKQDEPMGLLSDPLVVTARERQCLEAVGPVALADNYSLGSSRLRRDAFEDLVRGAKCRFVLGPSVFLAAHSAELPGGSHPEPLGDANRAAECSSAVQSQQ